MRIRERAEREATEAGEGLIEFINHRRAEQAQQRRQHILVAVMAALGIIAVLLTVANVILIRRLPSRTAAPLSSPSAPATARTEPSRTEAPLSVPSAPAIARTEPSDAADTATQPALSTIAPASESSADAPAFTPDEARPVPRVMPPPRRADATPSATRPELPSPNADGGAPSPSRRLAPPASAPTLPPAVPERAVSPTPPAPSSVPRSRESVTAQTPSDPAERTASWLVQTYGRVEAENRALRVAEFYSGERRAFWRRVLDEVRRTPEN